MKVETRNIYIANDGREFLSEGEALVHEMKCNIAVALETSGISFHDTYSDEVAEWIITNRAFLLDEFAGGRS